MKILTLVAAAITIATPVFSQEKPPPNVILLLADDMGYGDLAQTGNGAIRTPNLDKMAQEGIRLNNFYVAAPICSPSRVGFLTGQYPQRWKITSYLDNVRVNAERGVANCLDKNAPTLARCLQNAGYATGHFGKWHMGGQRDFADAPFITEYGFDTSLTQFEGLGDRVFPVFSTQTIPNNGGKYDLGSEKLGKGKTEYIPRAEVTGKFVSGAIQFIQKAKSENRPFYVNVWTDDPHTPVEPSVPFRGDFSLRTRYNGVLRELDRDLGKLIDFIRDDPELRDNTIIIFASDNGPEKGCGSAGGLRGNKGQLYEGGIREPFIVWAPGLMAKNDTGKINTKSVVSSLDLAPTILSITKVAPPANDTFDGAALPEIFLGKSDTAGRPKPLFWSRPPDRPGPENNFPDYAIRDGNWKLFLDETSAPELYNLADDPGEMLNKAEENPAIVAELTAKIHAWKTSVGGIKLKNKQ